MAEESEGNFDSEKIGVPHNHDVKMQANGWIVCRSQKRPGLLYDFNTNTGESVWRDPETYTHHSAIIDKNKVQFDCHEPTDPPVNPKPYNHHTKQEGSAAKIYNKQIINNQFTAKPFTIGHCSNAACAPYGLLNHNNAIGMATPQVWVTSSAPPVIIGSSVNPLDQLPTIYGGLENINLQNSPHTTHTTTHTLSHRFKVLKQMNNESAMCSENPDDGGGKHSFNNYEHYPQRQGRNFVNRHLKRQHSASSIKPEPLKKDLRSLLSSRRKSLQSDTEEKPEKIEDESSRVTEEDLNPDDTDKWLEVHTDSEGKILNIDLGCIWDLADNCVSRERWFIIATTRALLNNMRFLVTLVVSDERLRVLAPRDVMLALRKAAFSDKGRLADCAKRARTFVVRQMSKVPDALNNAGDVISCRELIGSNTLIVHLIDEKDTTKEDLPNFLQFTPIELKRYFESKMVSKPNPVSEIKNIIGKIKIVVKNDEVKEAKSLEATSTQSAGPESGLEPLLNDKYADKTLFKKTEFQTDLSAPSPPLHILTANACCQTDNVFTLSEINPKEMNITPVADTAQVKLKEMNITPIAGTAQIKPKEMNITPVADTAQIKPKEMNITPVADTAQIKPKEMNITPVADTAQIKPKEMNITPVADTAQIKPKEMNITPVADTAQIKPKEMNITPVADTVQASNNSIASKVRKIRLKRQQPTNVGNTSDEKKPLRWRKRKDAVSALQAQNSNKSGLRGSSPPPSSTSELSAQLNDTEMDLDQAKIVDESSTSAVISNSMDSETMFTINKEATVHRSITDHKEGIVLYEITSDSMEDRLRLRCDEWVSRFVQIMEEVLSQVLLLDPPFIDSTLPPPWTFQEATVCVKRKLKQHNIVVDASDVLDAFLMKINYDRGNIETRISPTDFMLMYSYGVNLVEKLQVVLKNCEDLHIASQNLSILLNDIREPNLDESRVMEDFNCENRMNRSPNISEIVTDASNTDVPEAAVPLNKKSKKKGKTIPCDNSPAGYSLRSGRSGEKKEPKITDAESKDNKVYSLFASLGLKQNKFVPDKYFKKTIFSSPNIQECTTPPVNDVPRENEDSSQDMQEKNAARVEPKIIRNFRRCPKFENKLKSGIENKLNCSNTERDQNANANYETCDYTEELNAADDYTFDGYVEAGGDASAEADKSHNDGKYDDLARKTALDGDLNYESRKIESADLKASRILKLVVKIVTSKYHKWLTELHKFCQVANTALKSKACNLSECEINVLKKTTEVSEHAKTVCNRLKSIVNRDPCKTRDMFGALMKDRGIQDFVMSDAQLAEYRATIGKYLELAEELSSCLTRLAATVKA